MLSNHLSTGYQDTTNNVAYKKQAIYFANKNWVYGDETEPTKEL